MTGDATVLGRIFQRLQRREQIDVLLSAVEEILQKHVEVVDRIAQENLYAMSLPAGAAEVNDVKQKGKTLKSVNHWEKEDHRTDLKHAVRSTFSHGYPVLIQFSSAPGYSEPVGL